MRLSQRAAEDAACCGPREERWSRAERQRSPAIYLMCLVFAAYGMNKLHALPAEATPMAELVPLARAASRLMRLVCAAMKHKRRRKWSESF
jgi:hypothetical protein